MVEPPNMEMEVTKNQLKKMYFDMTCIRCAPPTEPSFNPRDG